MKDGRDQEKQNAEEEGRQGEDAEVEDSEDFFFEKWGVVKGEILEKLNHLDALSRLGVVRRIDLLWNLESASDPKD